MKILDRSVIDTKRLPIKIVQFGDGNFLRGFADYLVDCLNDKGFNGGVAVIKNRPGAGIEALQQQEGLFTLFTQGIKDGVTVDKNQIISCIQVAINPYEDYGSFLKLAEGEELEYIFSNTTESGIAFDENDDLLDAQYHKSFPAKLTALLYRRYLHFKTDKNKGLVILPCELIENNGDALKTLVLKYAHLWQLDGAFTNWLLSSTTFCNTLVDRIVSGFPKNNPEAYMAKLDYNDPLATVCEPYLLWAIEGNAALAEKLPFSAINENVIVVEDLSPYRMQKVRVLNGTHTILAQVARLMDIATVKECLDNGFCAGFISDALYNEILPTIPLPETTRNVYTQQVLDRFNNPYVKHYLYDISLNSISKFEARLIPVIKDYYRLKQELPLHLIYAFACLIRIYKGEWQGQEVARRDDAAVIEFFDMAWQQDTTVDIYGFIFSDVRFKELSDNLPEFFDMMISALNSLEINGVEQGFHIFYTQYK